MRAAYLISIAVLVNTIGLPAAGELVFADDAPPLRSGAAMTAIVIAPDGAARVVGLGKPHSVVALQAGAIRLGQTKVSATGTWDLDLGPVLKAGDHRLGVTVIHADATSSMGEVRVSIPDGFSGELAIPYDVAGMAVRERSGARVPVARLEVPVSPSVRSDAEALAMAATEAFATVLRERRYERVAQADLKQQGRLSETPRAIDVPAVPENDFLAPVIEWLERSASTYQDVIVHRLSEGDSGVRAPDLPAPRAKAEKAAAPSQPDSSNKRDDGAGLAGRMFDGIQFHVQEWLARANRTYQSEIVRPLSQPSLAPMREFARGEDLATSVERVPTPRSAQPVPIPKDDRTTRAAEAAKQSAAAARKAAEAAKQSERQHTLELQANEARRVAALAEQNKVAEEASRKAKAAKLAEDKKLADRKKREDDVRRAEEKRLAEVKRQEEARLAKEKAEAAAAVLKAAVAQQEAERKRLADEAARRVEERHAADLVRATEAKRLADYKRNKLKEDERIALEQRLAEAANAAEEKRLADLKLREEEQARRLEERLRTEAERQTTLRAAQEQAELARKAAESARLKAAAAAEADRRRAASVQAAELQRQADLRESVRPKSTSEPSAVVVPRAVESPRPNAASDRPRLVQAAKASKPRVRANKRVGKSQRKSSASARSTPRRSAKVSPRRVAKRVRKPVVYVVRRGDTLSGIARRFYRDARRYPEIYRANRSRIRHPDLIWRGQKILIPRIR